MGILITSIVAACAATFHSVNDYNACASASRAGAQQFGIQQQVDNMEEHTVNYVKQKAEEKLGKAAMETVGGAYFVAKVLQAKTITFGLPTLGLCNSANADIGVAQSGLRFEWKF